MRVNGNNTNLRILRAARWILIAALSALLLYLLYSFVSTVIFEMTKGLSILGITFVLLGQLLMFSFLALIPGIVVYSLVTKRLNGLASCIGASFAIGGFFVTSTLPMKLGLFELLKSIEPSFKVTNNMTMGLDLLFIIGILLFCLFTMLFPFWLSIRIIRLTNEWLYPKIFKPLEDKL